MKRLLLAAVVLAAVAGSLTVGSAATLDVSSATVDTFGAGQQATTTTTTASTTTTTTTPSDTTAPKLVSLEMFDVNANGKVDRVVATFDETLAPSTDIGPWTLANVPSGGTKLSVSTSGPVATLVLAEGSGAANTAVGSFSVSLVTSATGIRDAAGNQSSFGATAPADKARPIPVSLTMANGGGSATAGRPDRDDTQTIVFSEALAPSSICPGTSSDFTESTNNALTATLTSGTPNRLAYSSNSSTCGGALAVGTIGLGGASYLSSGSATFSGTGANATAVEWSAANRRLILELGTPSSTFATVNDTSLVATYEASSSMTDVAGNPATGSVTFTGRQF